MGPPPENRLLARLPHQELARHATPVDLPIAQVLHAQGQAIDDVYFPVDAVVSMVADMPTGAVVEVATIGREGMAGVGALLRVAESDSRVVVQVGGRALRLPAEHVRRVASGDPQVERLLLRYVNALMSQIARSAACNQVHGVDRRIARWLLMTHDRVGRDEFSLTQEFLGQMLGVGRPRVSAAASKLRKAGTIDYRRGRIVVVDRPALEQASCVCYRLIEESYARTLG